MTSVTTKDGEVMIKRTIVLKGRTVEYYITRRPNMKRIVCKLKNDGKLYVSAPPQAQMCDIEGLLRQNESMVDIMDKVNRANAKRESAEQRRYVDGCTVTSLGERYPLSLTVGESVRNNRFVCRDGRIIVEAKSDAAAERLIDERLKERLEIYIRSASEPYFQIFKGMGVERPLMKMRSVRSYWGVCNVKNRCITYNTRLAPYPPAAIDYVIVHELSHFLHQNHSKEFYAVVESVLPDYKQRRDMLKQTLSTGNQPSPLSLAEIMDEDDE